MSTDVWWSAVKTYFSLFSAHADAGIYSYFFMPAVGVFSFAPLFAPNLTASQVKTLIAPLTTQLAELGIPFNPTITEYESFYPAWKENFPKEPLGIQYGTNDARLLPRPNFTNNTLFDQTFAVLQRAVEGGYPVFGFNIAPGNAQPNPDFNAVNPAWRQALAHVIVNVGWTTGTTPAKAEVIYRTFDKAVMAPLRELTPESGAYLNEANAREPDWQYSFYGSHYNLLSRIKKTRDPSGVFYAVSVGRPYILDERRTHQLYHRPLAVTSGR
jgi:hypothetical protein